MEIDSNTITVVVAVVAGVSAGVGLLAWTEKQGERTAQRANQQPCVECRGAGKITCQVCKGLGKRLAVVGGGGGGGGGSKEELCSFCDGNKTTRCVNCNGSGIQPRFLDRLSPDDFMD